MAGHLFSNKKPQRTYFMEEKKLRMIPNRYRVGQGPYVDHSLRDTYYRQHHNTTTDTYNSKSNIPDDVQHTMCYIWSNWFWRLDGVYCKSEQARFIVGNTPLTWLYKSKESPVKNSLRLL